MTGEQQTTQSFGARALDRIRTAERALHPSYLGVVVAAIFFAWSVSPSLLPRTWIFQGLVSGVTAAIGYGVGALLEWMFRRWIRPRLPALPPRPAAMTDPPQGVRDAVKAVVVLAVVVGAAAILARSARWQRDIQSLMGMDRTTTSGYLRTELLAFATLALLILLFRALRWAVNKVAGLLNSRLRVPRALALAGGTVVVAVAIVLLFQGILVRAFFDVANSAFSLRNGRTSPAAAQPQLPQRSGSPMSSAPWDTLGSEGRWFVSFVPTAGRIAEVTGRPATEPIRVYAGLESAPDPEAVAELVVRELERTKAFERKVLMLVTTTGTGWVDSTTAESIEYMYGGDTAIAATQYSYLPSVLSFLSDKEKATQAGRLLFDKVHARWSALPPQARPKLLVYGESLGSQGSEAAFAGLGDIRAKADGVLWVGPPNSNRIWSEVEQRRDPGTPEILPVYADGLVARFAASAEDLNHPPGQWLSPRVAYLQHASDPIVWWSPDLLFERPDWLSEPRGPDVSRSVRWWPIVTFWQISADLALAQKVPSGHGHRYGTLVLDAWAAVSQPPDWTPDLTHRIRQALDEDWAREIREK
ncbi:alpha/beta hydrolase [Nocardia wallacei]|uniref:alpha/beta hydrolase n=1 Tax=Nocardia wallacei TaxID=480035 RepID=UPI00245431ED|nr:alpha/beta hydrolase [Nocardia wallacei]